MRKKALSLLLVAAMTIGLITPAVDADAATKKVKISASKLTLTVGQKKTLTVKKGSKKVKGVKWKTSNKKVATVSSGKVTAKKAGKATITATVSKKKYTCKVTVKEKRSDTTTTATTDTTTTDTTTTDTTTTPATDKTTTDTPASDNPGTSDTQSTPAAPGTSDTTGATSTPDTQGTPGVPGTSDDPDTPSAQGEQDTPEEEISEVVKWTIVKEETFDGQYEAGTDEGGNPIINDVKLVRRYVSFDPWPTTVEQVEYIIDHCDNPFVIAALPIVALDNYEYKGLTNIDDRVCFGMIDAIQTGAGALTDDKYKLSVRDKQRLAEFGSKKTSNGKVVMDFASRAHLYGATPYNDYTPTDLEGKSVLDDKSKWLIPVDQYPYGFDGTDESSTNISDMEYITLTTLKYTEFKENETDDAVAVEHPQSELAGYKWDKDRNRWIISDKDDLFYDELPETPTPINLSTSVMYTNNYIGAIEDFGWDGDAPGSLEDDPSITKTWKVVKEETFDGQYEAGTDGDGNPVINDVKLVRRYVSFDPWPTTVEEVEYIIKNCKDPFVIAALPIVALDNYEDKGITVYNDDRVCFGMINAIQTGAGAVDDSKYKLSVRDRQRLAEFGSKKTDNGKTVMEFASRAHLYGATPYNDYTPKDFEGNSVLEDKTKWLIPVDQYPYGFDGTDETSTRIEDMKYITLTTLKYTEAKEKETNVAVHVEHPQSELLGLRWNPIRKQWLVTTKDDLFYDKPSVEFVETNLSTSVMYTNNYIGAIEDFGWEGNPPSAFPDDPDMKKTWKVVEEETFDGQYEAGSDPDGNPLIYPVKLVRRYVSFDPWPTTVEEVEYIIKNCKDPFVIAALQVVALDNYEFKGITSYNDDRVCFGMIDALQTGAGAVDDAKYKLSVRDRQRLAEYGSKKAADGKTLITDFASRAHLYGATPGNGYTPTDLSGNSVLDDKTKWLIPVDQYPYGFDATDETSTRIEDMKYITLTTLKYTESKENETDVAVPVEHPQSELLGLRWNPERRQWFITTKDELFYDAPSREYVGTNLSTSVMYTNNYVGPEEDFGWDGEAPSAFPEDPGITPTWKVVKEETFDGQYEAGTDADGNPIINPVELVRRYVTFDPWPTTAAEVEYIIKNCKDPFVIAALQVVALGNYEYKGTNNTADRECFKMIDVIQTGAGAVDDAKYKLSVRDKQRLAEFGNKKTDNGKTVMDFAVRAHLYGATPKNNYTPTDLAGNSVLDDKTKWIIPVDQYPYGFDATDETSTKIEDMKYITLTTLKYTEFKENESDAAEPVAHPQSELLGLRWNPERKQWLVTTKDNLFYDRPSIGYVGVNLSTSVMYTNNYVGPIEGVE
ncbi:MAG: Ig-like domain-containing protein [Lachnospiraceae bacterium]|nr:Ig-like domain-containing protein [Lachnospiraceae bacterium]